MSDLQGLLRELVRAHELGFLGPQPAELQMRHAQELLGFAADAGLSPTIAHRVADLGSGGGVPGLVGAVCLPEWHWFLVERGTTRARFLRGAIRRLELSNAEAIASDSTTLSPADLELTVVTARSYGPPEVLAAHARRLLPVGGHLLVSDPPDGSARWQGIATQTGFSVVMSSQTVSATVLCAV
jgi:16S rRNA (guanine527-N7)-methyltransferase